MIQQKRDTANRIGMLSPEILDPLAALTASTLLAVVAVISVAIDVATFAISQVVALRTLPSELPA